jgi:hypothetical protein
VSGGREQGGVCRESFLVLQKSLSSSLPLDLRAPITQPVQTFQSGCKREADLDAVHRFIR